MDAASQTIGKRAFVVAVAGGSGSGKTTFVRRLVAALGEPGILVIELDHYYRDLSHLSPEARELINYDHPDALELDLFYEHMEALARGETVGRPIYDFPSHTRQTATKVLESRPVIVIDGLFALYDSRVNAIADLKIFIDAAGDLRLSRRIRRDIEERGRTLESTLRQYFGTVKPMFQKFIAPTKLAADIVVPWHVYNDRAVNFIAQSIPQNVV